MHKVELYQENNQVQVRDALLCLEKQAPNFRWKRCNNKILDVGSGDGTVTKILKKFIPYEFTLVGGDINEDMVKFANEHYRDEQTSFTVLDIASELPEELNGKFDHVFSFYTLHWVHNQERAFTNIFDLMDQDGECCMIYLAWNPICDVFRIQARNDKWRSWLIDVEKYILPYQDSQDPVTEVKKIMEKVGFIDIKIDCKKMFFVYDDKETYRKAVSAIIPFKIPQDKQEEFMDEFMEELIKIHDSKNTQIDYKLFIILGHKPMNAEI